MSEAEHRGAIRAMVGVSRIAATMDPCAAAVVPMLGGATRTNGGTV